MIISFEEKNDQNIKPIYLKNKSRLPSVTDIKFINKDLIIVAHRYAYKLYLIKINNNSDAYEILDTFLTKEKDKNKIHFCESFEIKDQKIYLIFFSNLLWIIDIDLFHYKFIFDKSIDLKNKNTYHGIKIYHDAIYLTPSNMMMNGFQENLLKIDLYNHTDISYLPIGDIKKNYRIKDICFINDNLVLCVIIYKTNIPLAVKNQIFNGAFMLFTFPDFILLDKMEYHCVHFDRITSYQSYFYITGQNEKCGIIYQGSVDINNKKIVMLRDFEVFDFPHGIDICENLFSYTSYGNNCVVIEDIEKFI
jgi:hypothetical protein